MKHNRILAENIISLLIVQAANYILPILTFPYLVRILGIEQFGLLSFAFAFTQYFVVFIDYGYNLTATRQISINRHDTKRVSQIFCTVMLVKAAFLVVSILSMSVVLLLVPKFAANKTLYMICFLAVIGNYLFPMWFMQGIERIKVMSIINLATRLISTALIFILVKNPADLNLTAIIQAAAVIVTGLINMIYIFTIFPVAFVMPARSDVTGSLKDGWAVFITILSSTLMSNTNIVILGMFCENRVIGYYSIADKIVRAFINLVSPVSVAIFPVVSKLFNESVDAGVSFLRKTLQLGGLAFVFIAAVLFLGAGPMVAIVSGKPYPQIVILIRIMSILPLTIFIDNLYGTQLLINIGKSKQFMMSVLFPGLLCLLLALIFVPIGKELATAIIYLVSELCVLTMMMSFTRKAGIFLLRRPFV